MEWTDIAQIALTSGVVSALISGSIGYFSSKKLQEERRVYDRIHLVYFQEGLSQITTAVSAYGTSTVFAFVDLNIWTGRSQRSRNEFSFLESRVEEIRKRKRVSDLITRNLDLAVKWFPKLQRFGMPLYSAVKQTLQVYGRFLADTLRYEMLKLQLEKDTPHFRSGLEAVTKILQMTEVYLEMRLNEIENYVWKKKFGSYEDFLKVIKETKYESLLTELEEYVNELNAWFNKLTSKQITSIEKLTIIFQKA